MKVEDAIQKLIARHEHLAQKGMGMYNMETEHIINALLDYYHAHETVDVETRQCRVSTMQFPFLPARFSYFNPPVTNKIPYGTVDLLSMYEYIRNGALREYVDKLRKIDNKKDAREYKASMFPYVTFAGEFTERAADKLVNHSGYTCIDFDHLEDVPALLARLLQDEYFVTLLAFRSPSGDGLKWIVPIDLKRDSYANWMTALFAYIEQTYGVKPDSSGRDVARACFLSYDPDCYINPCLLPNETI